MEDNKLIAQFMGGYEPEEYEDFHSDWNWLMQVVEKIENTEVVGQVFNIQINRNKTHILYAPANYPNEKWFENLILKEGKDKILNTYQAIVEFIKWYNEQK